MTARNRRLARRIVRRAPLSADPVLASVILQVYGEKEETGLVLEFALTSHYAGYSVCFDPQPWQVLATCQIQTVMTVLGTATEIIIIHLSLCLSMRCGQRLG